MTEQRTHEIFSEPVEARVTMVERLIESLIDDETDSEIEAAWKEEARGGWTRSGRGRSGVNG